MTEAYDVQFLETALADMSEILESFIALGSRQGAVRLQQKIIKSAGLLELFPYAGSKVPDEKLAASGFRMVVIEKYLMFYKVAETEKTVLIYRLLNGKRDYPLLFGSIAEQDDTNLS